MCNIKLKSDLIKEWIWLKRGGQVRELSILKHCWKDDMRSKHCTQCV